MTKLKKISRSQKSNLLPELLELENLVAEFIQYWGFKKIHGRIWTHLYTSSIALDTAELMQRLNVSKGLMSLAIRDLLDYKVITPSGTGRHGTVLYTANPDLSDVITNVLRSREAIMMSATKSCAERLLKVSESEMQKHQINSDKIQKVLDLTTSAETLLSLFLNQRGADHSTDHADLFSIDS